MHLSATVELPFNPARPPELPLFVTFGWYLIVMMYVDAAVIGAAT